VVPTWQSEAKTLPKYVQHLQLKKMVAKLMFLSFLLILDNIFKNPIMRWQVKEVSPGVNKARNMGVPI